LHRTSIISVITIIIFHSYVSAQPSLSFDLKKPEKFENKKLGSEKTAEKKFTLPRRVMQNTITHYNYYYNANRKLDEIIERSKIAHKDDYTQLLPFYNYTLNTTAQFKNDLDSVIYKSTAGILLHDLRNDWVDNLYMLIGRAYFLRNQLDSAFFTFQYINYAFSPKEEDGYDKVIGSNQNEGGTALSIATREKRNIVKKALSRPPSRNESFIWQIRTYLERNELAEAAGMIETLKNDPLFPQRLRTSLEEVQAYWYYKQQAYDSAAYHLQRSLETAENKQEEARWEYLIAQLYERAGNHQRAREFYNKTAKHTLDPVLEVYARLNGIRQNPDSSDKSVQVTIDDLLRMARRDRYMFYRDVIYYAAAEIELERNNYDGARYLLLRSAQNSTSNPAQKSKSYLLLSDISFDQKRYDDASRFYDSVDVQILTPPQVAALDERKDALRKVVTQTGIIYRQDSVQRIAQLPDKEREAFIRRLVKQLRRQQGLVEDESTLDAGVLRNNNTNTPQPIDLFRNDNAKGEWYFSNASQKGKGYSEFKAKWGNRPNVDNWRRREALSQAMNIANNTGNAPDGGGALTQPVAPTAITYDALLARLPLTTEQMQRSLDSVQYALFALGKAYQDGLEDYPSAISSYEKLLISYPGTVHKQEAMFNLVYCYTKVGNLAEAERIKQRMVAEFPDGNLSSLVKNPDRSQTPDSVLKRDATKKYDEIYNLFIEGKFAQALKEKRVADSVYGRNYWVPQLLYIEAVYHVRERSDSTAISLLSNITQLYPATPIAMKSDQLIRVLKRRKEIETYLTNLKIERPKDDEKVVIANQLPLPGRVVTNPIPTTRTPAPATPNTTTPGQQQPVAKAPVQALPETRKDTTSRAANKPVIAPMVFTNSPLDAHYVVLVLDKVDPVYVTEARNAFNRYNREKFYNTPIEITNLPLTDDIKLVLFKNYTNAATAIEYIEKARKVAASEIIPWLNAQKYAFMIISESNLQVLQTTKDINAYRKFLVQSFPNYFK
jgi:outer membrane protein assembly factor BamD (BamD/ComL family)